MRSMRRWRLIVLGVLCSIGLLPALGSIAGAQDAPVPVTDVMPSSVYIAVVQCGLSPAPDGDPAGVPEFDTCQPMWSGSGTIVSPDGLILTNAHVALDDDGEPAWAIVHQTVDAQQLPVALFFARGVYFDRRLDLAILAPYYDLTGQPIAEGDLALPPLSIAEDYQTMQLEDRIRLVGYPGVGGLTVTIVTGQVTGFRPDLDNPELGDVGWTETSASAGPGVSGGTGINDAGELVGVPTLGTGGILSCPDTDGDGEPDGGEACIGSGDKIQSLRPIPEGLDELLVRAEAAGQLPGAEPAETPGPVPADPTATPDPVETPEPTTGPIAIPTAVPTGEPTAEPTAEPTTRPRISLPRRGTETPDDPATETAVIKGRIVSADTADPIQGAVVLLLQPGITIEEFVDAEGDPAMVYTLAESTGFGTFQLRDPVVREEEYGLIVLHDAYEPVAADDVLLATTEDPDVVDIGTIELKSR